MTPAKAVLRPARPPRGGEKADDLTRGEPASEGRVNERDVMVACGSLLSFER